MLKIFLLLILLSSCGDENKNSDQIVVGMSMDFPPFEFIQNIRNTYTIHTLNVHRRGVCNGHL